MTNFFRAAPLSLHDSFFYNKLEFLFLDSQKKHKTQDEVIEKGQSQHESAHHILITQTMSYHHVLIFKVFQALYPITEFQEFA